MRVLREAAPLLALLSEYLEASPAPSLPCLVERTSSAALNGVQRALMAGSSLQTWPREALAALQALLRLNTTLLTRCQVHSSPT